MKRTGWKDMTLTAAGLATAAGLVLWASSAAGAPMFDHIDRLAPAGAVSAHARASQRSAPRAKVSRFDRAPRRASTVGVLPIRSPLFGDAPLTHSGDGSIIGSRAGFFSVDRAELDFTVSGINDARVLMDVGSLMDAGRADDALAQRFVPARPDWFSTAPRIIGWSSFADRALVPLTMPIESVPGLRLAEVARSTGAND